MTECDRFGLFLVEILPCSFSPYASSSSLSLPCIGNALVLYVSLRAMQPSIHSILSRELRKACAISS